MNVGGRPGIYFHLKVPVHGRGLLGDFTVVIWRAGGQILLLLQHLWGDGMKSQLLDQVFSQSHTQSIQGMVYVWLWFLRAILMSECWHENFFFDT